MPSPKLIFDAVRFATLIVLLLFTFNINAQGRNDMHLNIKGLANLDRYLQQSESKFSDIVDGAEKHIQWVSSNTNRATHTQTELAIVYLHGFSASRQELSPVLETVANRLGANVFFTRLQGHGRSDDAMAEGSVAGWKNDVREAYEIGQAIGKRVILIGTSTGATLSTWAITQSFAKDTRANIMISPNYGVQSNSAWLMKSSLGIKIAKWINGDYHSFTPVSEQHEKFWTERYPLEAVTPMLKLVDEVTELDKSKTDVPQLLIYSPTDQVIDVAKVQSTAKEFSNAEVRVHPFTESKDHVQHVLAGVACSPESTNAMVELLVNYIQGL